LAEFEEAEEFARGALALSPRNLEALKSLARILISVRRAGEARAVFEQLQQAGGRQGDVQNGLGACFLLDNQPLAAIPCLDAALEDDPNNGTTWANRGIALKALGRYPEALESLQQAVRVAPDNAENLWNLSLAQLATGDYAEGWKNYEIRFAPQRVALDRVKLPATTIPQLMPGQDVNGKVVAVLAEQGLGDAIQFCRYAPLVEGLGASVILEAPAPLAPLMARAFGSTTQVIARGQALPPFDLHCPLMSLPGMRIGKRGIEKQFDKQIRGSAGASRVEVNAYGRIIRELGKDSGDPGEDVYLTIDREVQKLAAERFGEESGAWCDVVAEAL
jgi:hypothetical protein